MNKAKDKLEEKKEKVAGKMKGKKEYHHKGEDKLVSIKEYKGTSQYR